MEKHFRAFETAQEMIDYNTARIAEGGRQYQPWKTHRNDWVGREFSSWDQVCKEANETWGKGLRLVNDMLSQFSTVELPKPVSRKRKPAWSPDDGDEIENDRLRSGQDCWRTTRRQVTSGPSTVAIVANVCTSSFHESSDIIWRGAAAIVLANLLEDAGYRVELWAAKGTPHEPGDAGVFHSMCLKRADQPLDVATLVNAISGWFYRTCWIQTCFSEKEYRRPNEGRAGRPTPMGDNGEYIERLVGSQPVVFIEEVYSRDAALALVREVIEGLNK
jgi:hypothetical protein